jgi:hypothetical protein
MPTLAGCPINQSFLLVTNTDMNESGVAVYPLKTEDSVVENLLKSYMKTEVPVTDMASVAPADTSSVMYAEVNGINVQPSIVPTLDATLAQQDVTLAEQNVQTLEQQIELTQTKLEEAKQELEVAKTVALETSAQEDTVSSTTEQSPTITETFGNILENFTNCGRGFHVLLILVLVGVLIFLLSGKDISNLFNCE